MAAMFINFFSKISSTVYVLILAHSCYDTSLKTIPIIITVGGSDAQKRMS